MRNGYFKLVNTPTGYGIKLFPPEEGGEFVRIHELKDYLDRQMLFYDADKLRSALDRNEETVVFLNEGSCPPVAETYVLYIADDNMSAVARFYPPSETGMRTSFDEIYRDLIIHKVKFGVQMQALQDHFQSPGTWCTDIEVAKGREPRHGTDARIEYYFNTDVRAQPEMKEDGSVDYFHLNVINHCKKGEVLARIIPADMGDYGTNIMGGRIKPRDVKKANFKYGNLIELSEDRLSISSTVDGHVSLVGDNVFVSDVYEVENVDTSTGNIDFSGSVQVNGNVATNFEVRAKGDVVVNGVVEGATIVAGGNIIIARGMKGMAQGRLKAGGNVVAKFLENTKVEAEGYVNTEAILHSNVQAGTEIVVSGKRGFITGGHVQADEKIDVKTLGAVMGAATIVEVGVNPKLKNRYQKLQKEMAEIVQTIKTTQPILAGFMDKRAKGAKLSAEQLRYIKETAQLLEVKKLELQRANNEMLGLQKVFDPRKRAAVIVRGEVYPGTTIIIGDVSMAVQKDYQYCRFEKVGGDVKLLPI